MNGMIAINSRQCPSVATRLTPMIAIQVYLLTTVLVFAFGPWEWIVSSPWTLYGYLASAHTALFVGYFMSVRGKGSGYCGRFSPQKLVWFSVVIALLLAFPTSYYRTGNLIPNIWAGIRDPGAAYDRSGILRFHSDRIPVVEYIRFFCGPVLSLTLPLGIFFWNNLSRKCRIGVVLAVGIDISTYIAAGTNKGIADLIILFLSMAYAAFSSGRLRVSPKRVFRIALTIIVGIVGFTQFFANGMTSRGNGGSSAMKGVFPQVGVVADLSHPILQELPPKGRVAFLGLTLYMSVGYQGLAMSLEEPWVPSFGVGNSFFLQRQAERLTGNKEISHWSYPARIEKRGWDAEGLWSSIYPWIASDVSFPGSIILIFLVGNLFGKVWLDVITGANPFAVALFGQLCLMFFYFPANNQLIQSGEGLSAFFVTILCWKWTRIKRADGVPNGNRA